MASSPKTNAGAAVAVAAALIALAAPASAPAVAPAPCAGVVQINDVQGDGHHAATDILSAWFSEAAGRLQAVIKVRDGTWVPSHEDSNAAGYALVFNAGGQTLYVRAVAPPPTAGVIAYDYGTWTLAGGFVSAGATTGEAAYGTGGTVTIDVPAGTGAVPGTVLTDLFALTYDGVDGPSQPHWVDRGPGGTTPAGTEFGADYVVGGCVGTGGAIVAVDLKAPAKRTGSGKVEVRGGVVPATAEIEVALESRTEDGLKTKHVTTDAAGRFSAPIKLGETTRVRARSGGLASQTETVTMHSRTEISVRPSPGDGVLIRGRTDPGLPGKALLLGSGAATPSARSKVRDGRFKFDLERLEKGRYVAVYIPSNDRAERSTSNQERVK